MTAPHLVIPALGDLYRAAAPFTELAVRVCSGLSLAVHGYTIVFGDHDKFAQFFESAGFAPGWLAVWVVGLTQLVGGLAFALGLLTRVVAVPILLFLLTAIVYHWRFGFYWDFKGFEYPLFWALVTLHFMARGGGPYSLDALIGREV